MTKHADNETTKKQALAEFIRNTYLVGCSFHNRFVADCGRCLNEWERVLNEEKSGVKKS